MRVPTRLCCGVIGFSHSGSLGQSSISPIRRFTVPAHVIFQSMESPWAERFTLGRRSTLGYLRVWLQESCFEGSEISHFGMPRLDLNFNVKFENYAEAYGSAVAGHPSIIELFELGGLSCLVSPRRMCQNPSAYSTGACHCTSWLSARVMNVRIIVHIPCNAVACSPPAPPARHSTSVCPTRSRRGGFQVVANSRFAEPIRRW